MRMNRITIFTGMNEPTIQTFVEATSELPHVPLFESRRLETPGVLLVTDTFDVPDGLSEPELAKALIDRAEDRKLRENDMSVLYFYYADTLRHLKDSGILAPKRPAPLTVEEIEPTLRQLAKHPAYKHQTVMVISEDGILVTMKDGEMKREKLAA